MKLMLYDLYLHYSALILMIPLMVTMTISQEDVGKIKANLEAVLSDVKDLATQIKALMTQQAEMAKTLGIVCSQQEVITRTQTDHETRLRKHTEILTSLVPKVEEHDKEIETIKAVVFTVKGKVVEANEEADSAWPPLKITLILIAAGAAGGTTLLEFIKAIITGKP